MRKRRWWIAGLALALLATCVGVWKMDERPPFTFLRGASLFWVETSGSDCLVTYTMEDTPEEVRRRAEVELGGPWTKMGDTWFFEGDRNAELLIEQARNSRVDLDSGEEHPILPKTVKTVVTIIRPATFMDRFRAWLYRLSWKGNRP